MPKKVIIIGGGIAGLSAGCYARMNGFDTDIYEMHSVAGGLCTAWTRKEFVFDGCLHWLTGSDPSSGYYPLWEEIGAVQGKTMIPYDVYSVVTDESGNRFTIYTNPDKLREEMLRLGPEDRKAIDRIIHDIKVMMKYEMPPGVSLRKIYPMIRNILLLMKYREPVPELGSRFKNPVLRELFIEGLNWGAMCSGFLLWMLAAMGNGKAAYPLGGSAGFIRSVVERYEKLGGKFHFRSKVTGITVENGRATGITLADGTARTADYIISAADGHTAIYDWLGGKYLSKDIEEAYHDLILFPPLVYLSLGLNADYSGEPANRNFVLKEPIEIAGEKVNNLFVRVNSMDPSMAPPGKSVMTIMVGANWDYWNRIPYHSEAYKQEKKQVTEILLNKLAQLYPGLKEQIEETDLATPHTFVRYTGNWRGSYEGWLMDRKAMKQRNLMTLPGLDYFYMVGHWASPGGGLPSGLFTGRQALKKICKKEGMKFRTERG
jgi:phytoene dehydrogenase-like protein